MTRFLWAIAALSLTVACSAPDRAASSSKAAPQAPAAVAGPVSVPHTVTCPARGEFTPKSGFHSQYYEDYILAYVFAGVPRGAYVDVGANDPNRSSVTKFFYLKGWRGINIEPNPEMVALLDQYRPEDVNLGIGIADKPGTLTFYRFPTETPLSTFDEKVARQHQTKGLKVDTMKIPVRTLGSVLDEHPVAQAPASFLNIDVEGFERQVLSGVDLARHPISVVMAEATAPMTENPTFQGWESLLASAGYVFGMDDGLNRYYVNPGRPDLLAKFVEANYCVEVDKLGRGIKLNGYTKEKK